MNKIKIIATLGPSTFDKKILINLRKDIDISISTILESIISEVKNGSRFELRNFGSFFFFSKKVLVLEKIPSAPTTISTTIPTTTIIQSTTKQLTNNIIKHIYRTYI